MTGDGPLGYYLHNVYGTKWFSVDTEMEAGLRHRADQVPQQEPRPLAAVGHRPGVVSCWSRIPGAW